VTSLARALRTGVTIAIKSVASGAYPESARGQFGLIIDTARIYLNRSR
jgi:hypothetical protein